MQQMVYAKTNLTDQQIRNGELEFTVMWPKEFVGQYVPKMTFSHTGGKIGVCVDAGKRDVAPTYFIQVLGYVNGGPAPGDKIEVWGVGMQFEPIAPILSGGVDGESAGLSWYPSNQQVFYDVYRSKTNGGPYSPIAFNLSQLTYMDTPPKVGTYYYVVTATNLENGNLKSPNSNQVEVIIP